MFIFVVDTEQDAGNFERQLTAYMTGMVGDSGVGHDEANLFFNDLYIDQECDSPFADLVQMVISEDNGGWNPCKILETPGWFNNGWGNCYPDDGTHEQEAQEAKRVACLERSDSRKADRALNKYPAFLSVGIFLEREPTEEEIGLLKERALRYKTRKPITITGFRLLKQTTMIQEVWKS